jgi:hypothetical protein
MPPDWRQQGHWLDKFDGLKRQPRSSGEGFDDGSCPVGEPARRWILLDESERIGSERADGTPPPSGKLQFIALLKKRARSRPRIAQEDPAKNRAGSPASAARNRAT